MMYDEQQSDAGVVAMKAANKNRGRHPMFVTGKGRAVVTLVTGARQAASSVCPSLRLPQAVASS